MSRPSRRLSEAEEAEVQRILLEEQFPVPSHELGDDDPNDPAWNYPAPQHPAIVAEAERIIAANPAD